MKEIITKFGLPAVTEVGESGGNDDLITNITNIINAVIGLVVCVLAFAIVNFVITGILGNAS